MVDLTTAGIRDPYNPILDELSARLQQLPVPVVLTHLVDLVPATALPHLADSFHLLHTVAWRRAAQEKVRRGLIKSAVRRHRIKGTLAGFKLAAKDAGAAVTGAIVPPAKLFMASALTREERNAFVARYPQLRIYRYRTRGERVGIHCGDPLGRWLPVQSDAGLRIMPRAYCYRDGMESPLVVMERSTATTAGAAESTTVTEVAIPGKAGVLSFVGGHPRHLTVTEGPKRFYRMTLKSAYLDRSETLRRVTATPGLTPIDVRPDSIARPGTATGIHAGQFVAGHLAESTAADRIYQRLYLFDPDIDVTRRTATLHLNTGRLGMPAHHAELSVRISGRRHRLAAGAFVHGFPAASSQADLSDCMESMRDVARISDCIAINTIINRPVAAGESVVAGKYPAGNWITN